MRKRTTILGIDIGSNSIGWAVLETKGQKPASVGKAGVRVFEAGLEGLEMDGKGKSRNLKRREDRSRRRQTERRARRLENLARLLQRAGLLPPGKIAAPEERNDFFTALDKTLPSPYELRADALGRKLAPYELGRALYHLGQRRGFLSNRKAPPKKDEDKGKIKTEIEGLRKDLENEGLTLGAYMGRLSSSGARIRGRHTHRTMYEEEFERIWEAQKGHHPDMLTDGLKDKTRRVIYRQRPLKNQKELIGACSLEKGRKRAPWALLDAQRFRYSQKANDLRVIEEATLKERPLTPEERRTLIEAFETKGDVSFGKMRTLLKLRGCSFNLESGGEKKIPGNRTAKALSDIFKERWLGFSEETKNAIVEDVRSIAKDETLKKRGMRRWELDEETADEFGAVELEEGYCNYSKKAIERLLPLLMEGKPLQTAIAEAYPERKTEVTAPLDYLPFVRSEAFGDIRNPIVERALTELRTVVNAVIKAHGKPDIIRIELARDLRRSAKEREKTWKNARANEKKRKEAAEKITKETGMPSPKAADILKALFAEECNWTCPYTGSRISMASLIGDSPRFDIEHIIPFDRSLDDSFFNKTLCLAEENRNVKHSRTPYEAYSGTDRWEEILGRLRAFKGDAAKEKLRRFTYTDEDLKDVIEAFSSRQLNDTRYAARLAKRYLGLLYGGLGDDGVDGGGSRRVQATTGQVTAHLRNSLGLNAILGDGPGKSRDDNRHHAVDAIAIALTGPSAIGELSRAAASSKGRRLFGPVEPPWEGFFEDARREVLGITVSRRVSKRVRGALHEETCYSRPKKDKRGKQYVHIRKPVWELGKGDIENIVDDKVRERVQGRLAEIGGEPKKAFSDPANHPFIETKEGGKIPIHRVRIRKNLETFPVGSGRRERHVQSDSNHHVEIVSTGAKGGEKWEGHVVSLFEAYRRLGKKEPVIKRAHGEGKGFVFSLARGESIELDDKDGSRGLYTVRGINPVKQGERIYGQVHFVRHNDARKKDAIKKTGGFFSSFIEPLRKRNCRKVTVTPLGEVRRAND